jgi:hypothetical protein
VTVGVDSGVEPAQATLTSKSTKKMKSGTRFIWSNPPVLEYFPELISIAKEYVPRENLRI